MAFSTMLGVMEVLEAETLALSIGLEACLHRGLRNVLAKVDSRALHHLVTGGPSKWPLCNTIQRIKHLLVELSGSLCHIFREANAVADSLVTLGSIGQLFVQNVMQLPPCLRALVYLGNSSWSGVRLLSERE